MERDSFPAGEQDSGQGSGEENAPEFPSFEEHMEHMKQPEGKVNDGRVEKDSNGEDLEKTRNKFVNAYTLAAINKTLDIYKIVNDAERRYKEEAVEEKSIGIGTFLEMVAVEIRFPDLIKGGLVLNSTDIP